MLITKESFAKVKAKAESTRALVIGDVMLDRYIHGVVDRISPEAPVPIVHHTHTEEKAGGAANVALNLRGWGCMTGIIGMCGRDIAGENLRMILHREGIEDFVISVANRPTTVKTRVVASSHHLLRIDDEMRQYLEGEEEKYVECEILSTIQAYRPDLIVLEDYNKGLLTPSIIRSILQYAQEHAIFTAVDPKEQYFFEFKGASLFKPNLREASIAVGRHLDISDIGNLCREWQQSLASGKIAITLGGSGLYLTNGHEGYHAVPEKAIDVVDVCGAGDAVVCALALGYLANLDIGQIGSLANLTGAYVCSHSGVIAARADELEGWI